MLRRGSSPLTRGKPVNDERAEGHGGLIPTHAGKTFGGALERCCARAHPRSRGENPPTRYTAPASRGSSPLTRGKHRSGSKATRWQRLIPAHAGKTRSARRRPHGPRAHPRSRGENPLRTELRVKYTGSSPLTRGKRPARRGRLPGRRLIPAHAGKTRFRSFRSVPCPAHPRSRGENRRFPIGEYP